MQSGKSMMRTCFLAVALVCLLASTALADTYYIPHLTGGAADWKDYLMVDNIGTSSSSFTLTLYADGAQLYSGSHDVPAMGSLVLDVKSYASTAQCGTVVAGDSELDFRLAFENLNGGGVAEFRLAEGTSPVLGFHFTDFADAIYWKGAAITNMGDTPQKVILYAMGNGAPLGYVFLTVPAKTRVAGTHTTWFPAVDFEDIKKMVAVSTGSLVGLVISGSQAQDKLLFTQANQMTEFDTSGFTTAATDVTGTWTGTWTSTESFGFSGGLTLKLVQSGQSVSGTLDVTDTDCGDVSGVPVTGTVSDNTLTLSASTTCQGNSATLQYTNAVVSGDTMAGQYNQLVNGQPYDSGLFTGSRN